MLLAHIPPQAKLLVSAGKAKELNRPNSRAASQTTRERDLGAWTGSWTAPPDNSSAASAISAIPRDIGAANACEAGERAPHSQPVVGSSPTHPLRKLLPHDRASWLVLVEVVRVGIRGGIGEQCLDGRISVGLQPAQQPAEQLVCDITRRMFDRREVKALYPEVGVSVHGGP